MARLVSRAGSRGAGPSPPEVQRKVLKDRRKYKGCNEEPYALTIPYAAHLMARLVSLAGSRGAGPSPPEV